MYENGRKVYYEVDKVGFNFFLNPSTTSKNTIFIIVPLDDLSQIEKLQFHTRLGHMIQKYNLNTHKD